MAHAIKGIIPFRFLPLFRNYSKEIGKTLNQDFLLTNIKGATSPKGVLDIVAMHNSIMNNKHVMQALRTLFMLQKSGSSDSSTKQILTNPNFQKLCEKLRRQAAAIDVSDTIEALKVVSYVGVPSDSTIVQVLLQLVRHHINHLNLQQILFIDFIISRFKPSPLVDALKIALPIVFEIHLPMQINYDNAAQLAEFLFFATKHPMHEATIKKIVHGLLGAHIELDAKTAKSVVWSICEMENNELFEPLMHKAIDALVVHFDDLNYSDMETTLTKLSYRFTRKFPYFYSQVFFDSCANYIIDHDKGFWHAVYLIRKFSRIMHVHNGLLDYIAQRVFEQPELITKSSAVDIYSIVVGVSLTSYRPKHWELVKKLISQTENLTESEKRDIIWVKFASALCLLEIYKVDVLSKVLNETFLSHLFRNKFRSDMTNYLTCYECIKTYKPELNCLLSSRFTPEVIIHLFTPERDLPLKQFLDKALGGEKYVKSGLYTKLGQFVDHLVVFRKGGYPVALNATQCDYLEDFELGPENEVVVIQGLGPLAYTLNNRQLINSVEVSMGILERKGYKVVPVCLKVWEDLPEFEKIPFLMQAIKDKSDVGFNVFESVV